MSRERIRIAHINGKRVVVMDKVFDNELWKETLHNVCKVATSGTPKSIEKYVKSQKYAKEPWSKKRRAHYREIEEMRKAM